MMLPWMSEQGHSSIGLAWGLTEARCTNVDIAEWLSSLLDVIYNMLIGQYSNPCLQRLIVDTLQIVARRSDSGMLQPAHIP
jgi:hypothetical protein